MSDIYLVLRSRLESVAESRREWVDVGAGVMREARKAKGLSYETVGRLANVSSKTYERYEKAGRLPADEIDVFAAVLGLTIERPVFVPGSVTIPPGPDEELKAMLELVLAQLADLRGQVEQIRSVTHAPEGGPAERWEQRTARAEEATQAHAQHEQADRPAATEPRHAPRSR